MTGRSRRTRDLSVIAADIIADWAAAGDESHPAGTYCVPMLALKTVGVGARHGVDNGRRVVQSFLANAHAWRGPVADAIKTELDDMIRS